MVKTKIVTILESKWPRSLSVDLFSDHRNRAYLSCPWCLRNAFRTPSVNCLPSDRVVVQMYVNEKFFKFFGNIYIEACKWENHIKIIDIPWIIMKLLTPNKATTTTAPSRHCNYDSAEYLHFVHLKLSRRGRRQQRFDSSNTLLILFSPIINIISYSRKPVFYF